LISKKRKIAIKAFLHKYYAQDKNRRETDFVLKLKSEIASMQTLVYIAYSGKKKLQAPSITGSTHLIAPFKEFESLMKSYGHVM